MTSSGGFLSRPRTPWFVLACGAWVAALAPASVQAQTTSTGSGQGYPSRPIRLIVPFPPGGSTDTYASSGPGLQKR